MAEPRATGGWSLRRRITGLVGLLTAVVWIAGAAFTYLEAERESEALFDASIAETAHVVLALAAAELDEDDTAQRPAEDRANGPHSPFLFYQIWAADGHLRYRSRGAPQARFAPAQLSGYAWARIEGARWRVYSAWDEAHNMQIQIGERAVHRREISDRFAVRIGLLAAALLPLLGLLIWLVLRAALTPVQRSARAIAARGADDLRPVDASAMPAEVSPLLDAFNALLARARTSLDYERRFTANAAHELRTPLAGLRANVQLLQRAADPRQQREILADLLTGIDRCTRLIVQLLALARFDPLGRDDGSPFGPIALAPLLDAAAAEHRDAAAARGLTLRVEAAPAEATADAEALAVLLRNLVDNAIRYTPAGGMVALACGSDGEGPWLRVADTGPGIPAALRGRVFERFFRGVGQAEPGSGLGLSIVQAIAERLGARVTIGDAADGSGTVVQVALPR